MGSEWQVEGSNTARISGHEMMETVAYIFISFFSPLGIWEQLHFLKYGKFLLFGM